MMNLFCRAVAPSARSRLIRTAAPLACAWLLSVPMAHAAETMAMSKEAAMTTATPFGQYQKWRDEPVSDWTQSNDRVGEIGGWLTYLREAQQGDGATESSSGHSHHGH